MKGYRLIDKFYGTEPKVGEKLSNSCVWDGDEPTSEELPGTCAFDSFEALEDYAKYSMGWLVEVEGEIEEYGELDGEIILSDATITKIIKEIG